MNETRKRRIRAYKERDIATLVDLLDDEAEARFAARELGKLGARETAPRLMPLLDSTNPLDRMVAAQELRRFGHREALPLLREIALNDDTPYVRIWAVSALGDLGDPGDVDRLLPLLDDPSVQVRAVTAEALGKLGDRKALEPLRVARRRSRRSLLAWYVLHKSYRRAIKSLKSPVAS
jgi:HEAT repeat protein